ncbi:uncharacterized protein LOC127410397 [Myxocyprinus asiaticus]|uniref:uncharacterized protein LOC127410397 n=1 Tax=Myxocyprinus asiaticus TaxID=70543 RepID=UPI002221481F|nr:uncharacterized protein LOC127410397 [Myxocyprinus asiaticus]
MSTSEDECPVCKDKIRNPSQPSACCGKVFCQRCLSQSIRHRAHCPHCRSQLDCPGFAFNPLTQSPFDRRRARHQILSRDSETFNSGRRVANIRSILDMLGDAQSGAAPPGSLPNQAAPAPASQSQAPPILNSFTFASAQPVPLPLPRIRTQPATTATHPATVHFALSGPIQAAPASAPAPLQDNLEAEFNEWSWQTEITLLEVRQQQQSQDDTVRTFACPYCQENGLDELDLRDHCNAQHANDSKRVVCPVCVVMPHGDPQYYSRNFIGHLNLRHCYYSEDVTNINQSDEMNIQCALLASYERNTLIPVPDV